MAKKPVTIEHVDASIARWRTRLKRAMTALDKLEKQKKRLVKAQTKPPKMTEAETIAEPVLRKVAGMPKSEGATLVTVPPPAEIDTSIPAFLQRKPLDPVAAEIKAEQDETKRKKSAGRIAKMKAKQSGETRKMPLTGKAALAAIRNG